MLLEAFFICSAVPQFPVPTSATPTTQLSSTSVTSKIEAPPSSADTVEKGATPTAESGAGVTETGAAISKKKEKSKGKDNKKGKSEEGAGRREKKGAASEAPVDVSRLDLRIGRIIRAWKHPDADSLYVEEGVPR